MKAIFGKEPVVWLGILASLVLTIIDTVSGDGVIVQGNTSQTVVNLITVLGPIIAAFVQRNFVTPV